MLSFFYNDTATTEIYTLSLHDALPILPVGSAHEDGPQSPRDLDSQVSEASSDRGSRDSCARLDPIHRGRSEEHTSELQSRLHLVCRLLLEKKKKKKKNNII